MVAATREVLLGIRGVDGERIVADVVVSDEHTDEGLGGELHLSLVPDLGYYWQSGVGPAGAPVVDPSTASPGGWHGNRVVGNEGMQGFAVLGGEHFADGVVIDVARSTDLTPTAAAVGIPPAAHWTGEVLA